MGDADLWAEEVFTVLQLCSLQREAAFQAGNSKRF